MQICAIFIKIDPALILWQVKNVEHHRVVLEFEAVKELLFNSRLVIELDFLCADGRDAMWHHRTGDTLRARESLIADPGKAVSGTGS